MKALKTSPEDSELWQCRSCTLSIIRDPKDSPPTEKCPWCGGSDGWARKARA